MNIIASIEARTNSTRLPDKVLLPLNEFSVLETLIKRISTSKLLTGAFVATTYKKNDDRIVEICKKNNFKYFRGSEENVLKRVRDGHAFFKSDIVVTLTADNPLVDGELVDECIDFYLNNNYDFVTNSGPTRTYPDGLDVLVYSFKLLDQSYLNAKTHIEKEHITEYIYKSKIFSHFYLDPKNNFYKKPSISLTVDTYEEYQIVRRICLNFTNFKFSLKDILNLYIEKDGRYVLNARK